MTHHLGEKLTPTRERRSSMTLPEDQIEKIAQRAAMIAIEHVYIEIGRNVVRKTFWIVGAGVVALLAWLGGTGKL